MQNWIDRNWHWVVLLIIIAGTSLIRLQLLDVPLERDEGEYAYAGQLILQGIPPYAQVYNMKLPGIYASYALIMAVFGETHSAIHFGLLLTNALTTLLLFLLGRRLLNRIGALTAAAAFAVMSMGHPVQGIFANAEHFVILPAIGGLLLLLRALDTGKRASLFAASVLLGTAFVMKQHGVAFLACGAAYLLLKEAGRRPMAWKSSAARGSIFLAGSILPFGATCLVLYFAGVFEKFWFWTFTYATEYVASSSFAAGSARLIAQFHLMLGETPVIWILAAIGLASLAWNRKPAVILFSALLLAFSILAVFPGFYFRPHYFVLLLPAVALFSGFGVDSLNQFLKERVTWRPIRFLPVILVLFGLVHGLWNQREFLFFSEPNQVARMSYGANPFPESLEIARVIRERTGDGDRIAVIGSEPQIYFYANRHSASGHIYTYALMESHPYARSMQEEMIREIENARPRYLVFVNVSTSWLVRPYSDRLIFSWFEKYSQSHYDLEGIVEIGRESSIYMWDEAARSYRPRSPFWLTIFARKD